MAPADEQRAIVKQTLAQAEVVVSDKFIQWPFPIVKPETEWNEFDRHFLEFMQVAYDEGYGPRHKGQRAVEATSPTGRSVFLAFRGCQNGWEPWLSGEDKNVRLGNFYGVPLGENACVCVRPPFRAVGYLAIEWLRGKSLEKLLIDFSFVDGHPPGIELKAEMVVLPLGNVRVRDRHITSR